MTPAARSKMVEALLELGTQFGRLPGRFTTPKLFRLSRCASRASEGEKPFILEAS
jgi:hypothetical protein